MTRDVCADFHFQKTMSGAHEEVLFLDLPEGILSCVLSALPLEQLMNASMVSLHSE